MTSIQENEEGVTKATTPTFIRRRATIDRPPTLAERIGYDRATFEALVDSDRAKYGNEKWYRDLDEGAK